MLAELSVSITAGFLKSKRTMPHHQAIIGVSLPYNCSIQRALVTLSLKFVGVQLPSSISPNRDCVTYFIPIQAPLPWTENHVCMQDTGAQIHSNFCILISILLRSSSSQALKLHMRPTLGE